MANQNGTKMNSEQQKIWDEKQGALTKLAERCSSLEANQKDAENYTAAVEARNKLISEKA